MKIGIAFDSTSGAVSLAMADLVRACKADGAVAIVAPPETAGDVHTKRSADLMIWVVIINATLGVIHLARFIYDVLQQRKVEVSITLDDGKTYKIKTNMSEKEIVEIFTEKD